MSLRDHLDDGATIIIITTLIITITIIITIMTITIIITIIIIITKTYCQIKEKWCAMVVKSPCPTNHHNSHTVAHCS